MVQFSTMSFSSVQLVIQNQLTLPLFWPAASHPMMLQTTVFNTWLTTHS